MKQGSLSIVCLVIAVAVCCAPAWTDEITKNISSVVVDTFDGEAEWSWTAQGSKFVTEGYPKVQFFDHVPLALRNVYNDPEGDYKVLGVEVKFDRQGDNWVDIYPIDENGEPFEIPMQGIVSRFDLWVWGSNFNYYLELLVRDSIGRVHTLDLGSLCFPGWKNLYVNFPTSLPQTQTYIPKYKGATLVALRLRTRPTERVDGFRIFFDQLKVLTDLFESSYDGWELLNEEFDGDDESSNNGNSGSSAVATDNAQAR